MWLKKLGRYFQTVLVFGVTFLLPSAVGEENVLPSDIESCLSKKMTTDYPAIDGASIASYYLPNKIRSQVVAVVLGEAIATNSYDDREYVIGVGGEVSPNLLAKGLEEFLVKSSARDSFSKSAWPGVTLAYYTHYSLTKDLEAVTSKYKMKLSIHSLDSRTKASLIGSGC